MLKALPHAYLLSRLCRRVWTSWMITIVNGILCCLHRDIVTIIPAMPCYRCVLVMKHCLQSAVNVGLTCHDCVKAYNAPYIFLGITGLRVNQALQAAKCYQLLHDSQQGPSNDWLTKACQLVGIHKVCMLHVYVYVYTSLSVYCEC